MSGHVCVCMSVCVCACLCVFACVQEHEYVSACFACLIVCTCDFGIPVRVQQDVAWLDVSVHLLSHT